MLSAVLQSDPTYVAFEAETPIASYDTTQWQVSNTYPTGTLSGNAALRAIGTTAATGQINFPIQFTNTGNYRLYVKAAYSSGGDNSMLVPANGATPADAPTATWDNQTDAIGKDQWHVTGSNSNFVYNVGFAGQSSLSIAPREAGYVIDRIVLSTNTNLTPAQLDAMANSPISMDAPNPVTTPGDGVVALNWTPVVGAASYTVKRDGTTIASNLTNTFFTDTGRTNGNTYSYTVAAINGTSSAESFPTSATPTDGGGAPGFSPFPTVTAVAGGLQLSWSPVFGASSYDVLRSTTSGTETFYKNVTDPFLLDTVAPGTTYYYEVTAKNHLGSSGFPGEAFGTGVSIGTGTGLVGTYRVDAGAHDFSQPVAFAQVDGSIDKNYFNGAPLFNPPNFAPDHFIIRWTGQIQAQYNETYTLHIQGDDGIRLYVDGALVPVVLTSTGAVTNSWVDQGPTDYSWTAPTPWVAGSKHDITVEYYENGGGADAELRWESPSTPLSYVPRSQLYEVAPTVAPTITGAAGGNGQAALFYTIGDNTTAINIYRSTTSGSGYQLVNTAGPISAKTGSGSFIDSGLTNGTTYYYIIKGANDAGEGPASNEVSIAPSSTAVPMSTTLSVASNSAGQVVASWVSVPFATSYTLKRSSVAGGPYTNVATGITGTTYTDTTVTSGGSQVFYVVTADNANGSSPLSNEASTFPLAGVGTVRGNYFAGGGADNEPSVFGVPDVTRMDPGINFASGNGVWIPANYNVGEVNGGDADRTIDSFSVLWTGRILADVDGTYTIISNTDDAGYLWVDDTLVSSDPNGHGQRDSDASTTGGTLTPIHLTPGWHNFVYAMGEGGGGYGAALRWALPGSTTRVVVPTDHLAPTMSTPLQVTGLTATDAGPFVKISFTDTSISELGYKLQRSSDGGTTWKTIQTSYQRNGNAVYDVAPIFNQPVKYRVVAFNYDADATPSDALSFTHSSTDNPNGLLGSYYPRTQGLDANTPNFDQDPTVVRIDPQLNFDSGAGDWTPNVFNGKNIGMTRASTDSFSVRWTGQVMIDADGTYSFYGNSDDASFVYVDNQLVSSYPGGHGMGDTEVLTPITLTAGLHNIVVDMGEGGGGYGQTLNWSSSTGITKQLVPSDHLFSRMAYSLSNLTATPADNAITLNWTSSQGQFTQTLIRSTSPDFSNPTNLNVPLNASSFTDTGLTTNTTYYYKLTATSPFGDPITLQVQSTTGATAPADPTNLYARAISGDKVLLTWKDNAINETHYSLERKDATAGGAFAQIALLDPNTITYTDADPALVLGHTYTYRVRALNENSFPNLNSNYSNESSAVTVTSTLPAPWVDSDIGVVSTPGSGEYDVKDSAFFVTGSGDDIWGTADSFNYTYQPVTGDAVITARVLMTQGPDGWTKAGVMARNDLTAGSQDAFMMISRDNGYGFQSRQTAGAATNDGGVHVASSSAVPIWLRIVRVADTFTGFASSDGVNYSEIWAPSVISMGQTIDIGMAVTAHNNASPLLGQAMFDNVTIQTVTAPTKAPAAVSGVAYSTSDVRLAWGDSNQGGAEYRVERATSPSFSDAQVIATTQGQAAPYVFDRGLTANTTYYYRITPFNSAGAGPVATFQVHTLPTNVVKYVNDLAYDPNAIQAGDFVLNGSTRGYVDANQNPFPFNPANNGIRVTTAANNQTSSLFSSAPVDLSAFHVGFDMQDNAGAAADGMTFAVVGSNTALGGGGGSLGYQGITGNSVAIKFDIYNNIDKTDLLTNGNQPDTEGGNDIRPSGLQFRSGNILHVDLYYNSNLQALSEIITDLSTGKSFSHIYTGVNLPSMMGASTAYIGFTGATGGANAEQDILAAEYDQLPLPAPTQVTGTNASSNIYIDGTGGSTNFWINHDPTSTPADISKPTATSTFSIDAKGGTVTFDMSNFQPLTPLGLTVTNIGTLRIIGTTGNDTVAGVDGALLLNGNALFFAGSVAGSIQYVGNGGADSLGFSGGTYTLGADVGAGGTTATMRVSNNAVVNVNSGMHLQTLSVSNTGKVLVDNVRGHTMVLANDLSLADSAIVDLNDNDLVFLTNNGAPGVSPVTGLSGTIAGGPSNAAIASDMPGAEGVAHAIDGQIAKYLNFGNTAGSPGAIYNPGDNTGFYVTPVAGSSVVTGLRLFTANDSENRDPSSYTIEGTNDNPSSGTAVWTSISGGGLALPMARNGQAGTTPVDPTTMANQEVDFANSTAYKSYRVLFPTVKGDATSPFTQNSMQIGEVQLMTASGPLAMAQSFEQRIKGYVTNGSANIAGPKIIASSASDASSIFHRTLAVADNTNLQFTTFSGETFPTGNFNQILVKYTYFGDANLDGQVSPKDYAIIDGNIGPSRDWGRGDLNGDGNTNPTDYAQIDGNIGAGNGTADGGPRLNAVVSSDSGSGSGSSSSASGSSSEAAVVATTQPAANSSPFSTTLIHDNSDVLGSESASVLG